MSDVLLKDAIRAPDLGGISTNKDFTQVMAERIRHTSKMDTAAAL